MTRSLAVLVGSALTLVMVLTGCAQPAQTGTTPPPTPAAQPATPTAEPTAEPTPEPAPEPAAAAPGEPRVPLDCASLVTADFLGVTFDSDMTETPWRRPGSPGAAALGQVGALTCNWRGGDADEYGFTPDWLFLDVLTDADRELHNGQDSVDTGYGAMFDSFADDSTVSCSSGGGYVCEIDGIVGPYWVSATLQASRAVDIENALAAAQRLGEELTDSLATAEPLEPFVPPASDLPPDCAGLDPEGALQAAFPDERFGEFFTPGHDAWGAAAYEAWDQAGLLECSFGSPGLTLSLMALPGGAWAWDAEAIADEVGATGTDVAVPNSDHAVSLCREQAGPVFCRVVFTVGNDYLQAAAADEDGAVAAERSLRVARAWAAAYSG